MIATSVDSLGLHCQITAGLLKAVVPLQLAIIKAGRL